MEFNKRKKSSKIKVDSFYARIAEKGKRMREADDMEDIGICEWIDLMRDWKLKENEREKL